jgi:hypothetical protein
VAKAIAAAVELTEARTVVAVVGVAVCALFGGFVDTVGASETW